MKLSIGISRLMLLVASTAVLVITTTTTTATAFRYSQSKTKVHVLVYETEQDGESPSQRLVEQINKDPIRGIHATLFGQSNAGFTGYGSKFSAVLPLLRQISNLEDGNTLVVLSDSRDVLVNNPYNDHTYSDVLADEFQVSFEELTALTPNAIVISAEAQCCVSALTHVPLGGYYNFDGSRKATACSSGTAGCLWAGDDKAVPWENFMMNRMLENSHGVKYDDAYLNAGLMVGRAKDLLRVIAAAQINDKEDDQAVWTDYMYHHPNDIVLDYQQRLFGNNRGGIASLETGGCVFELQPGSKRLVHVMTNSVPLFLHSPGAFFTCHDQMATALNVPQVAATIRRKLVTQDKQRRLQCNYGRNIDGTACVDDTTSGGGLLGYLNRTNTTESTSGGGLLDYLNQNDTTTSNSSLTDILSLERNETSAPFAAPLSPFAQSLTNTSGSSSSGGLSDFLESSRENTTSTENTTSLADLLGASNTTTPTTTTSLADILGASNTSTTTTATTSLEDIFGGSNSTTEGSNSLADILGSTSNSTTTPTDNTTTVSLVSILGNSSSRTEDTTNATAPSDLASFLSSTSSNTTAPDTSNVFSFFNSTTDTTSTTNATAPSSLSDFLGSSDTNTTTTTETDDGYSDDSIPTDTTTVDTSTVNTTTTSGISDDLSNALGEARNQGIRPTGRRLRLL